MPPFSQKKKKKYTFSIVQINGRNPGKLHKCSKIWIHFTEPSNLQSNQFGIIMIDWEMEDQNMQVAP